MKTTELILKYGCNPHQTPARIHVASGPLPLTVLNGSPGYINLLDALNSWQLVRELRSVLQLPAAASFKHVSPAGTAVGLPLSESLAKSYFVAGMELSPLATAYVRARGADRVSSFGDWVALSDIVDESTALVLKKEVSDGVIAPGYTKEALAILNGKKNGAYTMIEIDPSYKPEQSETRTIFGITFEQRRNDRIPGLDDLQNIVTQNRRFPDHIKRDLLLTMITLKYTQSNSVCYAVDGQTIGCGAGQQSRIHCTRLAGTKSQLWFLRQHPKMIDLPFQPGVTRTERDNIIDQLLRESTTPAMCTQWSKVLLKTPTLLTISEKRDWLAEMRGVSLGSDAYFPQRDNIDEAYRNGVQYIVQPGGSVRDQVVIDACDQYGMVMAFSNLRLFHH